MKWCVKELKDSGSWTEIRAAVGAELETATSYFEVLYCFLWVKMLQCKPRQGFESTNSENSEVSQATSKTFKTESLHVTLMLLTRNGYIFDSPLDDDARLETLYERAKELWKNRTACSNEREIESIWRSTIADMGARKNSIPNGAQRFLREVIERALNVKLAQELPHLLKNQFNEVESNLPSSAPSSLETTYQTNVRRLSDHSLDASYRSFLSLAERMKRRSAASGLISLFTTSKKSCWSGNSILNADQLSERLSTMSVSLEPPSPRTDSNSVF